LSGSSACGQKTEGQEEFGEFHRYVVVEVSTSDYTTNNAILSIIPISPLFFARLGNSLLLFES
jgi:hypothetical protein